MPYILGVDIGTGSTITAVSRLRRGAWSDIEVVGAADAAGREVPGLLARVGDDVPLVLDGVPYRAPALAAELAARVVDQVEAEEGGPAEQVAFVVPAGWGPYRCGLMHEALWRVGLDGVLLLTEPVAAAEGYAATRPVDVGTTLAVYSLGDAGCTCSVVRRTSPAAFEVLAGTEVADGAGGADLDDLLMDRVLDRLAGAGADRLARAGAPHPAGSSPGSPPGSLHGPPPGSLPDAVLVELRRRCREARAELNRSATATIAVPSPGGAVPTIPVPRAEVTVGRADVEELVRPVLDVTVAALVRTVRAAGVPPQELAGVLLTGEGARMPLARRLVEAAVPARLATGLDPVLGAVYGAVHAARTRLARPDSVAPYRSPEEESRGALAGVERRLKPTPQVSSAEDDSGDPGDEVGLRPPRPPVVVTPLESPRSRSARRPARDGSGLGRAFGLGR